MIKKFTDLSQLERQLVLTYINQEETYSLDLYGLDKHFKKEIYHNGEGVIFYFKGQEIVGKAQIILLEAPITGNAYITSCFATHFNILKELIQTAVEIIKQHNGRHIFLGTMNSNIIQWTKEIEVKDSYQSLVMTVPENYKVEKTLETSPVHTTNMNSFLTCFNDIFSTVPNGGTMTYEELETSLTKTPNMHYFVHDEHNLIGVIQLSIEENIGYFDIGLLPPFQSKGYGQPLVHTAISLLRNKNVNTVSLVVITKNNKAFSLYKKLGFTIENVINEWFQLT